MKKMICILLTIAAVGLLACCGNTQRLTVPLPQATYLIDDAIIAKVCSSLVKSGLNNTDLYKEWVKDFSDTAAKKTELPRQWVAMNELKGDLYACADYWEASHSYSDANCRMTAMLLMGDLLRIDNPKREYGGTYLMMDIDAIENETKYSVLKAREFDFTTLFGEIEIPESGLSDALPQNWKEHGIHLDSKNVSLISVVMEDTMSPCAFVGHAGLLIDEGEYLLFLEKLAFEQPYQATKLHHINDLVALLSSRPEYAAEDGKEQSIICQNDKVIGSIEANHDD